MSELSGKEHWDSIYEYNERPSLKRQLKLRVKKLLGPKVLAWVVDYSDYLLWEVIFKAHLPPLKGAKVLEVGSAPGTFLAQFSQKYECTPYGVEYSDVGVQVNRKIFSSVGINPDNVIHADFFSDQFNERYQESFDVVISRGFIE